ncbi:fluoride efflux transporter CrcB [Singulisphaera sp. Ch08]|uniref:Fluoride-specific ion channel FluC n=1 Tax=Singulisphaera sp. Ch08 TaxID=3120278 RepID=A0AAU7CNJ3_9BACT
MERWATILVLTVGGAIGVNARHFVGIWVRNWAGHHFPWGTFLINVSGSFAIGFLAMALERWLPSPRLRLLIVTGFLGGYTTFSSYMMESMLLWERGEMFRACAYFVGSAAAGLLAVIIGMAFGRSIG